jgi:hypothetical protein
MSNSSAPGYLFGKVVIGHSRSQSQALNKQGFDALFQMEWGEAFGEQLRARNQYAEAWIFIESKGMPVLPRGMKLLIAWLVLEG